MLVCGFGDEMMLRDCVWVGHSKLFLLILLMVLITLLEFDSVWQRLDLVCTLLPLRACLGDESS
jgi:hypothetical protein